MGVPKSSESCQTGSNLAQPITAHMLVVKVSDASGTTRRLLLDEPYTYASLYVPLCVGCASAHFSVDPGALGGCCRMTPLTFTPYLRSWELVANRFELPETATGHLKYTDPDGDLISVRRAR